MALARKAPATLIWFRYQVLCSAQLGITPCWFARETGFLIRGIPTLRKKVELRDVYRDVRSGRFVTEQQHERLPNSTEHARRPVLLPKPEHPHKGKPR